jgi:putative tricarboxylic transport membrane protein
MFRQATDRRTAHHHSIAFLPIGVFMRRDDFLKSLAALLATGAVPLSASAATNLKMMIPANPGGGWDSTGRALGKALIDSKTVDTIQYENKGGAAGALGLAQFASSAKGDGNALMVMGAVMLGGIISNKPPVGLDKVTPIARLTSEYNVFVLPPNSPFKTMKDVVEQLKKDPASVKWGGGSRGSTEHIAACMLARAVGVDPKKVNYVAFRGGGEATAAILGGNVTVGGSGYSEFAEYINSGKMKPIGVTSDKRIKSINVPTMKEQGYNVILGNWRGVYAGAGLNPEQRKTLTDAVLSATKTSAWSDAMAKNSWTPALMIGKEFEDFVEYEFTSLRAIMYLSGMQ